ncbi:tyrosine-type recombinase/integrase [Actinomadura sp. LOL_016]|uniref:tyrosine-type recombinase/integrase n=1 Tax=unclassified Actinomadura TaxID=2626254 RepID=UPI003A807609
MSAVPAPPRTPCGSVPSLVASGSDSLRVEKGGQATSSNLRGRAASGWSARRTRGHVRRHTHATTPLLAGVPVRFVAVRLGHAEPAITLRVYAHAVRSAETAAADVFAKVMVAAA